MINFLEGEKIIIIKRKHWFIIALEGLFITLVAFLPFLVLFTMSFYYIDIVFLQDYQAFLIFFGLVWLVFSWMLFFLVWTNYYLDILLITNKRIIDIEQHTLFSRDFAEMRLENIQDIKVEVMGIIPELLKMGDLHIQSAGLSKEVVLKYMPNPYELKNIISKCHDEILKDMHFGNHRV